MEEAANKPQAGSVHAELGTALHRIAELEAALRDLIDCPDLNLDSLEPITRAAIDRACSLLLEAQT